MFVRTACRRKPDTAHRQSRSYGAARGPTSPAALGRDGPAGGVGWRHGVASYDGPRGRRRAARPRPPQRLLRTVDGLLGDDWSAPVRAARLDPRRTSSPTSRSTREGADRGSCTAWSPTSEDRSTDVRLRRGPDADIARRSPPADPDEIRDRLIGAATRPATTRSPPCPTAAGTTASSARPAAAPCAPASLAGMRLREVEIHHVDLDAGYSRVDWSEAFAVLLLDAMAKRLDPPDRVRGAPARRRPDLGARRRPRTPTARRRRHRSGRRPGLVADRPRPAPETLSCSRGELPRSRAGDLMSPRLHRRGLPRRRARPPYRGLRLEITKLAVDEQMSNNCYLLRCTDTGDQVLIDAADDAPTAARADRRRRPHHRGHHPPALGPPPRARRRRRRPPARSMVAGEPDADAITEQTGVAVDQRVGRRRPDPRRHLLARA